MELLKVRADISIEDKLSKTALDLAMFDSAKHGKIIEALQVRGIKDIYDFDLKSNAHLFQEGSPPLQTIAAAISSQPAKGAAKQLIITTGDTSDVDGFLALAEYSKVVYFFSKLCRKL